MYLQQGMMRQNDYKVPMQSLPSEQACSMSIQHPPSSGAASSTGAESVGTAVTIITKHQYHTTTNTNNKQLQNKV